MFSLRHADWNAGTNVEVGPFVAKRGVHVYEKSLPTLNDGCCLQIYTGKPRVSPFYQMGDGHVLLACGESAQGHVTEIGCSEERDTSIFFTQTRDIRRIILAIGLNREQARQTILRYSSSSDEEEEEDE